jgi:NAD(P)-dependent dehydrogenase (short-subunit alcohol dehydrogenase family)
VLLEETLHDPGCVEVGRVGDQRTGVGLSETPFPDRDEDGNPPQGAGMEFDADSVFLVTGAAGSIVSAITADLAAASGGVFHLLDLTPTPDADDPDLQAFRHDRDGLKATIAERMKGAGDRPTPVAIERELSRYERLDAALAAVQSVEAAGGTVHYHSVDLTDAEAVAEALANVADASGRIDVLLHAAGLEISRNLPDKERREYDLVFDVKADGWFNVFHAAQHLPIGATVVFSSVAGRFGNQGQTDYSAANDLLCKITSNMRRARPDTRAIALDWTAWGGIGMATRGSIPKIMEMAGVQMLPPEAGVAWIRRELTGSDYRGEVVVAGTLGMMAAEYHNSGGVDSEVLLGEAAGPMVGSARLSVHDGVVVETSLDPVAQPFLDDHRIDGTPVLPGVMGLEAFAETARLVAPGYQVIAVEDVSFAAPLKFYRDEPRSLTVTALVQPDGKQLVARCQLMAERHLPGQEQPQRTVHFTGNVRLASRSPRGEDRPVPGDPPDRVLDADGVYSFYFHGPAYQVVGRSWRDGDMSVAELAQPLPPNQDPVDQPLLIAPRLIELCFQTAGLWLAGRYQQLGLPSRIGRVQLMGRADRRTDDQPRWATAEEVDDDTFSCAVVDGDGNVILTLEDYRTVQLPTPIPEDIAAELSSVYRD